MVSPQAGIPIAKVWPVLGSVGRPISPVQPHLESRRPERQKKSMDMLCSPRGKGGQVGVHQGAILHCW